MVEFAEEGIVQTTKVVRLINVKSSDKKARMAIRQKAYELFLEGEGVCAVAQKLGVQPVSVSRWFKAFRQGDDSLLKGERRRGAVAGRRTLLDKSQMEDLRKALVNQSPIDYSLPYKRWSFSAVQKLVGKKFGLDISRVTAGKWLAFSRPGE